MAAAALLAVLAVGSPLHPRPAGRSPQQAPGGTGGPPAVRSARLVAGVAPDGAAADVRVEYRVSGAEGVTGPLRLELLGFGPATADSVHATGLGEGVALRPEAGSMRAATLALPPGAAADGEVVLSFAYRVDGAVERAAPDVRVRIPVLVLDLPPVRGAGPVFRASVRLPAGWAVAGGFPTGLAPSAGGAWEVDLPVVPALVSLRGRTDGARRPGLPETLDALALVLLAAFGVVGWKHLRGVAA